MLLMVNLGLFDSLLAKKSESLDLILRLSTSSLFYFSSLVIGRGFSRLTPSLLKILALVRSYKSDFSGFTKDLK